jgi:hypothetical protein
MPRSISNSISMRLTACSATGEIAAAFLPRRALAAISANSKNCRKPFPHIGVAGREPDPHPLWKRDHGCSNTSRTRRSAAASTPVSTITRDPRISTISIRPDALVRQDGDGAFSMETTCSGNDGEPTRRGFVSDNRRRKHRGLIRLDKPAFPSQPAPCEQLARGQPVSPRRHRHKPWPAIALRHDPVLLFQCPTAPGTRRNHIKPGDLRNRRMLSHTPMSSPLYHVRQGGLRRRNTIKLVL